MGEVAIIGGTKGIGRHLAFELGRHGSKVAITSHDTDMAKVAACELNVALNAPFEGCDQVIRGLGADLACPNNLAKSFGDVTTVDHLVFAEMVEDRDGLAEYDINQAHELATTTIVGYVAALHILKSRLSPLGSVLILGGISRSASYRGSAITTAVDQAIPGLVATFARKLAPVRVNSIHPGIVFDTPPCAANETLLAEGRRQTILKRLPTMDDIIDGCIFLMNNPAATAINLSLDAGIAQHARQPHRASRRVARVAGAGDSSPRNVGLDDLRKL